MSFSNKFRYAFQGLLLLIRKDKNFQIQLALFCVLIAAGFFFDISNIEWIMILICSALVLSLEAFNSSVEKLADIVHEKFHLEIKKVKDISAGAVFIAAIFSLIVALIIFIPKIEAILNL